MKARLLKADILDDLRSNIRQNLGLYRNGDFNDLIVDTSNWIEIDVNINEKKLAELKVPDAGDLFELENCIIASEALAEIRPYGARDERLWTYLTHTILLEYSRKRWPIPDDDEAAIIYVQNHFFGKEKRQIERDNAISRLWWISHLCSRVPSIKLETGLQAFLFRADVRASIIERPTTSQSLPLFTTLIKKLAQSFEGSKALFEREVFRKMMREINSVGGSRLLDCLDLPQVELVLDGIIKDKLQLKSI